MPSAQGVPVCDAMPDGCLEGNLHAQWIRDALNEGVYVGQIYRRMQGRDEGVELGDPPRVEQ
eukprot:9098560-Alexandrium_andersonii.AAC.1